MNENLCEELVQRRKVEFVPEIVGFGAELDEVILGSVSQIIRHVV